MKCTFFTPAHLWHSTWGCMCLASCFLFITGGQPFRFCSRAQETDGTANPGNGSYLFVHLDLPCPRVPKYALHLRVPVVRTPDCVVLVSVVRTTYSVSHILVVVSFGQLSCFHRFFV
jgi:hypothetical protein